MLCPKCDSELIVGEIESPDAKAVEQWFDCPSCGREFVVRYSFGYVMDTDAEKRASSWEKLK